MDSIECVVIGAGVIGLAIARQLAQTGRDTLILERHPQVGSETSSRNSEVVHAGLYYPRGSLKAQTCVRGRELLYAYCERHGVPYRRSGKLIVATDETQMPVLAQINAAAPGNGVDDLRFLDRGEAKVLEPALHCVGALLSPSTGIVDSHAYMLALLGEAERYGATLARRCRVADLALAHSGVDLRLHDDTAATIHARWLVNAAGLDAAQLARRIAGFPSEQVPPMYFAKGSYFTIRPAPFSRLVYPVPEPGGLGIHFTIDLAGQARFGPDVEWVDRPNYDVDAQRAAAFYRAIRVYYPALADGALEPAYAGIRPKTAGPGQPSSDFRIDGPSSHGVPGIINLFGIESPGLTASLAIAEHVAKIVADC